VLTAIPDEFSNRQSGRVVRTKNQRITGPEYAGAAQIEVLCWDLSLNSLIKGDVLVSFGGKMTDYSRLPDFLNTGNISELRPVEFRSVRALCRFVLVGSIE
jgi:hypothetical protein